MTTAEKNIPQMLAFSLKKYLNRGGHERLICESNPTLAWARSAGAMESRCDKEFYIRFEHGILDNFKGFSCDENKTFEKVGKYDDLKYQMFEHSTGIKICAQDYEYACDPSSFGNVLARQREYLQDDAARAINHILNFGEGDSKTAFGLPILIGDKFSVLADGVTPNLMIGCQDRSTTPYLQAMVKRPGWAFPKYNRLDPMQQWNFGGPTLGTAPVFTDPASGAPVLPAPGLGGLQQVVGNPYTGEAADPADQSTWWQPLTLKMIQNMLHALSQCDPSKRWNGIMQMDQDMYDCFISLLTAMGCCEMVTVGGDTISGGMFTAFRYMGITGFVDDTVKPGTIRFLTTDRNAFKVATHQNQWMTTGAWLSPYDQQTLYACLNAWFGVYSGNPRLLGEIQNVSHAC